jgi:hypothetical protein
MDEKINNIIQKTVLEMLADSVSDENIRMMTKKHTEKIHFIPVNYRVFGGILQGLNIKFGNFIEQLIGNIVEIDTAINAMEDSGKKVRLFFTPQTDALIDAYITRRQLPTSPDDCTPYFDILLSQILEIENSTRDEERQGIVKDIDGLFITDKGLMVYTELKYNDDHDTGKFADINRKFIKTWAGLAVRLKITRTDQLFPIIYYFNSTKRYGPIHTPSRNIMRGPQLFDKYLQTKYADVYQCLSNIGDDPEILKIYDDLYKRVRNQEIHETGQLSLPSDTGLG